MREGFIVKMSDVEGRCVTLRFLGHFIHSPQPFFFTIGDTATTKILALVGDSPASPFSEASSQHCPKCIWCLEVASGKQQKFNQPEAGLQAAKTLGRDRGSKRRERVFKDDCQPYTLAHTGCGFPETPGFCESTEGI